MQTEENPLNLPPVSLALQKLTAASTRMLETLRMVKGPPFRTKAARALLEEATRILREANDAARATPLLELQKVVKEEGDAVRVELTPQMREELGRLLRGGLHGASIEAVAGELLRKGIRDAVADLRPRYDPRPPSRSGGGGRMLYGAPPLPEEIV